MAKPLVEPKQGMSQEEFSSRMNRMQKGQATAYGHMKDVLGIFLALCLQSEFLSVVEYLEDNFKNAPDFKMLPYFRMIRMFVLEFKKVADNDPKVKELVEQSERLAFMKNMGGLQ